MRHRTRCMIEAVSVALGLCGGAAAQSVAVAPLTDSTDVVRFDFGRLDRPVDLGIDLAAPGDARPLLGSIAAFRIGWRSRSHDQPAWARPGVQALAEERVTRVGIQWKLAPSQIDLVRGGIGLRLDGAEHLSIRLRKGSFSVYLNRRF